MGMSGMSTRIMMNFPSARVCVCVYVCVYLCVVCQKPCPLIYGEWDRLLQIQSVTVMTACMLSYAALDTWDFTVYQKKKITLHHNYAHV